MFLQASVILLTGGSTWPGTPPGTRYTAQDQVHPPGTRYTPWDQVHPQTRYTPRPGTPPRTRYTPWDQVHPPGPGTPPDQVPPQTRYTPHPRPGTPPRTWYTPPGPGTPPGAEHAGRYGQCTGGTHPTGMQSCSRIFSGWAHDGNCWSSTWSPAHPSKLLY